MKTSLKVFSALVLAWVGTVSAGSGFHGRVTDSDGAPVPGALVSARSEERARRTTVYTDEQGHYTMPELPAGSYDVRARSFGYRDGWAMQARPGEGTVNLELEPETDEYDLLSRLPANRWVRVLLDEMPNEDMREEFRRQCTFCHQQGNWATRVPRDPEQWQKIFDLMARMGGVLTSETREVMPALFNDAYAPEHAFPQLRRQLEKHPLPQPAGLGAVVDEWFVGTKASFNHDVVVHPDGSIYTVDMTRDMLRRLDPETGDRQQWKIPDAGLPLGGVFPMAPIPSNADSHVGPHSLQVAPDGKIWTTLALGNKIGIFDPDTERWKLVDQLEGYYPHTLRFDDQGRAWYTVAVSNHLAMLGPDGEQQKVIRLPAKTWAQAIGSRLLPAIQWLGDWFSPPTTMSESALPPTPYGIDIGPDGDVWFSQLNVQRIGRYDPETEEVELFDTPFPGPRRLRFDSKGNLWIPGFSAGVLMRFRPETGDFQSWELPIEPKGTETPYALNVHRKTDTVWVCGTNSDTLIRFEPDQEKWTVYPMPSRVTYTREIDFDEQGGVWTSNSNLPAWQIETDEPQLIRIRPEAAQDVQMAKR